jgi:hypothetical protein
MHQNLSLQLTLDETNLILNALGQQPYIEVQQVIEKIRQQSYSQLRVDEKPELEEAEIK